MAARWIRRREELDALAGRLVGERIVALDSESDSFHHYKEKVCLIQLALETGDSFLIDPLELKDLSPLAPMIADPAIEKVFHGADYDVATMKRDFNYQFANLFDTMVASRFLGRPEVGLQAVLAKEFNVTISKDLQRTDWSRRPLSPREEEYASADVGHLIPLRQRLVDDLKKAGREEWVREECAAIARMSGAVAVREPADFFKARGARDLHPISLAVLRELFALREARAKELDRPLFKVLADDMLVAIAAHRPRDEREVNRMPRIPVSVRRMAREIVEAVKRGEATPKDQLPAWPRTTRLRTPGYDSSMVDRLKAWRSGAAGRMKLDPGLLLPQRLIDRIAKDCPKDRQGLVAVEGLRGWRIAAFGDELLGVVVAASSAPSGNGAPG